MRILTKIRQSLVQLETGMLLTFLGTMILLGILQILIRKIFNESIPYADQIMNMLVLYLAMIGAALATLKMKHINFEVASKFFKENVIVYFNLLVNIFSIYIMYILFEAVLEYIEIQGESLEMFFPTVKTVTLEKFMIPGTVLIIIGFLINLIESVVQIVNPQGQED